MASRRRDALAGDPFGNPEETFAQADEGIFGRLGQVDKGREVIRSVELMQTWPDLRQPRRIVPHSVRKDWDGNPATGGLVLTEWYHAAMAKAGEALPLRAWLEGKEVNGQEYEQPLIVGLIELCQLAASIKRYGLKNPITVYEDAGLYRIDTGERRWLATILLKLYFDEPEVIKARIIPKRDVWSQALENGVRKDLNAISMARQLALLVMDMYPGEFDEYQHLVLPGECDRKFYAQVADGNKWRVAAGMSGQVAQVMGISSTTQINQHRRLLSLPDAIWLQADEENWTEGRCREWFQDANGTSDDQVHGAEPEAKPTRPLRKAGSTPSWTRERLTEDEVAILRFMTEAQSSPREALKPYSARASLAAKRLIERVGDEYLLTEKAGEYGYRYEGAEESLPQTSKTDVYGLTDEERAMLQFMCESGQDYWSPGDLPQPRGIRASLIRKGMIQLVNGFYRLTGRANDMGFVAVAEEETSTTVEVEDTDEDALREQVEEQERDELAADFAALSEVEREVFYDVLDRIRCVGEPISAMQMYPLRNNQDNAKRQTLNRLAQKGWLNRCEGRDSYTLAVSDIPLPEEQARALHEALYVRDEMVIEEPEEKPAEDIRARVLRDMPVFDGPWEAVLRGLLRIANVGTGRANEANALGELIQLSNGKLEEWVAKEGAENAMDWLSQVYLTVVDFFGDALQEKFEHALEMVCVAEIPGGDDVQEG